MAPSKARAPPGFEEILEHAEELVGQYFACRQECPEQGTIDILGERYVLVRAASLSVEFFGLVRDLFGQGRETHADDFARNILFDLAHSIGKSDARRLHEMLEISKPLEKLVVGPVHFAHTGWAFVDLLELSESDDEGFYLRYDHPYSFEAEAWLRAGHHASFPVCIMNAGYSSGWVEESYSQSLVASEMLCRAKGDEVCRFIMAPPDQIESRVEQYIEGQPALAPRMRGYQVPDFFARKHMEEELRRAHDELEQRVEERTAALQRANDQLKREITVRQQVERKLAQSQKLEAIGRLAGGIAHDFNNLMGVVIGQARMLETRMPADFRSQLEEIREAGERASELTNQLLAFSRAQTLTRDHIDLNTVVNEVAQLLQRLIGDDIELVTSLTEESGYVGLDRGQLTQLLLNLAVNARDAMGGGGTLRIETDLVDSSMQQTDVELPPGWWFLLTVSDTGEGMDEQTRAHLFDPFYTTKHAGEGTGLGLSTVHGIVKRSGGQITVDSQPGHGARFRIYLPEAEKPPCSLDDDGLQNAPPEGHETVLVVEDQAALLRMVTTVLEDLGYKVLAAQHPEEAIQLVEERKPSIDLVVSDVIMPKLSGPETVKRIRALCPDVRVLYVSGYSTEETLPYGVAGTGDVLLSKPFTPETLAHRVRQVLDADTHDAH